MGKLIDFDNSDTFPKELQMWDAGFEKYIKNEISLENVKEWWQIKTQLEPLHLEREKIVTEFLKNNMDTEVAVYHCTRILNEDDYLKQGIVISGGRGSLEEKRIRKLFSEVKIPEDMIEKIFEHIYKIWDRDKQSRTTAVHFFSDKKHIYDEVTASTFAINLGGEIVRWSMEAVDINLYKQEPYKRLWILGKPCIIKFKCKLSDIAETKRDLLIAEIVNYFIVTKMYGYPYRVEFTGMTTGNVPPENIISIEEIKNFIEIQGEYEDEGFYDELK